MNNIYRPRLYCGKDGISEKFVACTSIAKCVKMWLVVRSHDYSVSQVAETIIDKLK